MARGITIELKLDVGKADSALKGFTGRFKSALDSAATVAATTGRRIGSALDAGLEIAARKARDLSKTLDQLGSKLSSVSRELTLKLTVPLVALGAAAVKTATDFDSLKRGMIAVSGSAAAAEKQMARLKEVAKLPGLGFREAIQGSINLQAAGLSAERSEKALRAFGNALATVGKGKAELDGVILALSQIESKGKVSAEEINQIAERVPQIRQIMLKAFGTADTEVIQRAKITSGKFIDAVTAELARLPQVTGGARNAFENLKDSIEQSLLPLGNKLLETILPAIEKLSPKILGLLEGFGKLSSGTQQLVIGFGAAAIAAGPVLSALANMTIAVRGLTGAVVGLNAASSTGLMARLLSGPVILTAAVVGTTAIQTFREATGNQEMIDKIGGPDLDRISRILKERGLSGAGAFRQVAQELKDQALLAKLVEEQPGVRLPMSGAEAFRRFGGGRPDSPVIDANALAAANAAASKTGRARRDRFVNDFGLNDTALLEHEAELARIRQSNEAVVARRELERLAADRPAKLAGFNAANEERFRQINLETLKLEENTAKKALEELKKIEPVLSNSERLMKGFGDATQSVGDAFERFGANVANAFGNVRDLFNGLKQSVLQFFNDILGSALQNIVRSTLGGLFGGGGAAGGGIGGLFRTPGTFPAQIAQAFAGAGGGSGLAAPPSISLSSQIATGIFANGQFAAGLTGGSSGGGIGKIPGLDKIFTGISNKVFASGAVSAFPPLLGATLGAGLGGQSTAGRILGAIGGGAVGLGAAFGSAVFGAGGGIAQAALAALGPAALIGVPLLVGAILLGKASQRRKDEEAAGQLLGQAFQAVEQLKAGIASDQIEGSQARGIFESQIVGPFVQQINQLKTASVRRDWVKNQVPEIRKRFEAHIPPEVEAQAERRRIAQRSAAIDSRLVPQFAIGGIVPGRDFGRDSVLSMLRPNEMVLTVQHQAAIKSLAGADVFGRVGVPGVQQSATFQTGGIAPASNARSSDEPLVVYLDVRVGMSDGDAQQIAIRGMSGRDGQQIVIKHIDDWQLNRRGRF